MIDFERDELPDDPHWRKVLESYQAYQPAGKDDAWVPRLCSVEGISPDQLPRIHGKLIALGLLKFQLAGRESGICYQLSTLARHVLAGTVVPQDDNGQEELEHT
jgi:hypothetical protein